ncbi:MAG: hypothetical protein K2H01_12655 [Ruminococcus sp.]|nr:hypothetical protein [Ruminococcus sp.]
MKNKIISSLTICLSLTLSVIGICINPVYAAEEHPDFKIYACTGEDRKDTVYISTEELANGNVNIPVDLYTVTDEWNDPYIKHMLFTWESSDATAVRFANPMNYTKRYEERIYTYSGGSFRSKLKPYMLAYLHSKDKDPKYITPQCNFISTEYTYDPIFGSLLYSDGNGGAYFSASYNESHEDALNGNRIYTEIYPTIIPNEDGSATFTYEYIRQDNFEKDIAVGTIPYYDPKLEKDEIIPGKCNVMMWQDTTNEKREFLGRSDEFPSTGFDAVVLQGTPVGTYKVNIVANETYFNEKGWSPSATHPLTIIVTDDPPETTTTTDTTTTTITTSTTTSTSTTTTALTTTFNTASTSNTIIVETTTTTTEFTTTQTAATTTTTTEPETTSTTTTTATASNTNTVSTTATTNTSTSTVSITNVIFTQTTQPAYLSKNRTTLYKGMPIQLYVYNADNENYQWKTTNENIASVSQNGLITANSTGTCRVYTTVRGKVLVCNVTVKDGICGDVDISGKISLIDAVWLGKYISGGIKFNQASVNNADCYRDGIITGDDIVALLAYLSEKINVLPLEGE